LLLVAPCATLSLVTRDRLPERKGTWWKVFFFNDNSPYRARYGDGVAERKKDGKAAQRRSLLSHRNDCAKVETLFKVQKLWFCLVQSHPPKYLNAQAKTNNEEVLHFDALILYQPKKDTLGIATGFWAEAALITLLQVGGT
jgi:hypothetical protein